MKIYGLHSTTNSTYTQFKNRESYFSRSRGVDKDMPSLSTKSQLVGKNFGLFNNNDNDVRRNKNNNKRKKVND